MFRYPSLQSLLLLIVCSVVCLLMLESSPRYLISVNSEASVYEMSQVIKEQRERIEYLSSHPKVVLRCLDDEVKIKYPRKANDELTEITMSTNDECGDPSATDAVMIVHTAANHFLRRQRFRKMYANFTNTKPYRLKVVFLIGSVLDASLKIELEKENMQFGDTVVGAFLDTYQNLTLKGVMGYRWLSNTCPDTKLLIKMDDDVFFDVRKFYSNYWLKLANDKKVNSIHCRVWYHAHVGRKGKWKVEKDLFANSSYPFPYCAGMFAAVTPSLIRPMYVHGKNTDFFWIDDVFMYGMVPAAIKGVHFFQVGGKNSGVSEKYQEFKQCTESKGREGCPIWAALTDGEKQFDAEYEAHISQLSGPQLTAGNQIQAKDSRTKLSQPHKANKNLPEENTQKKSLDKLSQEDVTQKQSPNREKDDNIHDTEQKKLTDNKQKENSSQTQLLDSNLRNNTDLTLKTT